MGLITCADIVGCATHFVQNRTVPCEKEHEDDFCQHCQVGHSWRWHGYVSAILTCSHEHILFEFTRPPADTFKNYLLYSGTLRGCLFTSRRPSGRPNGRVVVSCKSVDQTTLRLPEPPNIRNILCRVWNIKTESVSSVSTSHQHVKALKVKPSNGDGRYKSPADQPK